MALPATIPSIPRPRDVRLTPCTALSSIRHSPFLMAVSSQRKSISLQQSQNDNDTACQGTESPEWSHSCCCFCPY
jgi:hypothetical protein